MLRTVRPSWLAGVLCGLALAACAPARDYPEPAADSFTEATFELVVRGDAQATPGARVSAAFFEETQVSPVLGRAFVEEDYRPDSTRVAMVGHSLWQDRFAGRPTLIGESISLDGRPAVVVGVMPAGFDSPPGAVVWVPRAGS